MANPKTTKTDTTNVGIYDSSIVVAKTANKPDQLIIIKDYKTSKETPFYETPIFISIIFPFIVSVLTIFILRLINNKKNNLDVRKIQQDIKGAEQALKDEQVKLELSNKNYLLEINKLEKDYKAKYDNLLEERKKYNLELLKYKEQQISELKLILKNVQKIISDMENEFILETGWEITTEDYLEYQAEYFIKYHKEINKQLRSILSEAFLFHSVLNPLFSEAINSITILMNRINRDQESGNSTNEPHYIFEHIDQAESIATSIKAIINKIREIIDPILAI